MIPELYVPTVPWRAPALTELMRCLAKQTTRAPVTFVLDGHTPDEHDQVAYNASALGLYHRCVEGHGAGSRWRWASRAPADVLVLSLDDDMLPGPLYVQTTLAAWGRLGEPFSWCGDVLDGRTYVRVTAAPAFDQRLFNAGAGALCVPAELLRGIEDDPAADRFLGKLGHDEALVSWWLTTHGARLWRPRGAADIREHDLGHDKRSQWNSHGTRCAPLVAELERRGWPVVAPVAQDRRDVSPAPSREGRFRGTLKRG